LTCCYMPILTTLLTSFLGTLDSNFSMYQRRLILFQNAPSLTPFSARALCETEGK
jgi:hypothetical protein